MNKNRTNKHYVYVEIYTLISLDMVEVGVKKSVMEGREGEEREEEELNKGRAGQRR